MSAQDDSEEQARAERAAASMYARDTASRALGMELLAVAPGRAEMAMTVRPDMVNGHDICHGGLIFALADSTFAFACNSYDTVTVARQGEISFLAPARRGDRLTARCVERMRQGRSGIYDVSVVNEDGAEIAIFRGWSSTTGGQVSEEE